MAAVGRRAAGIPMICSPASRPPATVSVPRGEHGQGVVVPGGLADRVRHALVPLLHLRQPGHAADEGDPPVPALEQVVGGQPAAEDVVDGDRALVGAGRPPVDEHHRHAALAQRRRGRGELGGRRDEHALHALLGQHVEVRGLLGRPVVGVAEDDGEPLGVRRPPRRRGRRR